MSDTPKHEHWCHIHQGKDCTCCADWLTPSQTRNAETSEVPKTWTCNLCKNVNYEHLTHCASCSAVKGSPSQPGSNEELSRILDKNTFTDERGYSEPLRENLMADIQALLTTKERAAYERGRNEERAEQGGRYCGVCFLPCYEHGGWKCEKHGYKSVYLKQSEAVRAAALAESKETGA